MYLRLRKDWLKSTSLYLYLILTLGTFVVTVLILNLELSNGLTCHRHLVALNLTLGGNVITGLLGLLGACLISSQFAKGNKVEDERVRTRLGFLLLGGLLTTMVFAMVTTMLFVDKPRKNELMSYFKSSFEHGHEPPFYLDRLQKIGKCCGLESAEEYGDHLPLSCCIQANEENTINCQPGPPCTPFTANYGQIDDSLGWFHSEQELFWRISFISIVLDLGLVCLISWNLFCQWNEVDAKGNRKLDLTSTEPGELGQEKILVDEISKSGSSLSDMDHDQDQVVETSQA